MQRYFLQAVLEVHRKKHESGPCLVLSMLDYVNYVVCAILGARDIIVG